VRWNSCSPCRAFGADAASFLSKWHWRAETDLHYLPQKVALLTLHASKGPGISAVFIAGCEDGILPLRLPAASRGTGRRTRRSTVGMTRAQQRLILTAAHRRRLAGRTVGIAPALSRRRARDLLTTSRRPAPPQAATIPIEILTFRTLRMRFGEGKMALVPHLGLYLLSSSPTAFSAYRNSLLA